MIREFQDIKSSIECRKRDPDTEEATKTWYILKILKSLWYKDEDIIPEFVCNFTEKGEKVDYALMIGEIPIIIVEAKKFNAKFSQQCFRQLARYYSASESKVAVWTNGLEYRFYTDMDKINIMDEEPFFIFNMLDYTDEDINKFFVFHRKYIETYGIESSLKKFENKILDFSGVSGQVDDEIYDKALQEYKENTMKSIRMLSAMFDNLFAIVTTGKTKEELENEKKQ